MRDVEARPVALVEELKELKKKAGSGKIGYVESTGKLPPGYADMSDEQKEQVAEDMAMEGTTSPTRCLCRVTRWGW